MNNLKTIMYIVYCEVDGEYGHTIEMITGVYDDENMALDEASKSSEPEDTPYRLVYRVKPLELNKRNSILEELIQKIPIRGFYKINKLNHIDWISFSHDIGEINGVKAISRNNEYWFKINDIEIALNSKELELFDDYTFTIQKIKK
jgi:hypothetical protein